MPTSNTFQLRTPPTAYNTGASAKPSPTKPAASKSAAPKQRGKVPRGIKRKRGKGNEDASSSLSELSDSELDEATAKRQMAATMTKSGRQVQKPTQFNPADTVGAQKRKHYGKRTAEQALCKVCTRGQSPHKNHIVFCDGCNYCWHQLCHDPYIDDDFVSDESRSWFCSRCEAKREKALAKKKTLGDFKGVSWASKSADQVSQNHATLYYAGVLTNLKKRTYLTNITHAQLVNIIMYSTELHPELPIFPAPEPGTSTKRGSQGLLVGTTTAGPANFVRSESSMPDAKTSDNGHTSGRLATKGKSSNEVQGQAERESSVESIPPAWPKVGQGVLAGLDMDEDDLQDNNDYEAFSVTSYDGKGRKVIENGIAV
jgi:hypothetical protein